MVGRRMVGRFQTFSVSHTDGEIKQYSLDLQEYEKEDFVFLNLDGNGVYTLYNIQGGHPLNINSEVYSKWKTKSKR